jgi:hypothetical protein
MEGKHHTVADQYALRGVRAPTIHLNVRYIPLRAVLDVADLLSDARNIMSPWNWTSSSEKKVNMVE